MSYLLGSQTTNILPSLSLLVVGTAPDGPLGEARFVSTPAEASQVYGGTTVARFTPAPASGSHTFPSAFSPDDESLRLVPPRVYTCPPGVAYSVSYPSLGNLAGSGSPLTIFFDPLGTDPSVTPPSGGIFLEADSLLSPTVKANLATGGFPTGELLLPLTVASLEASSPIGAYRVGTSWLPLGPPKITLTLPNATQISLTLNGQGDNTASDRFMTPYLRLTPTALICDPGLLGLPYVRRTYTFSSYPTWLSLLSDVNQDCLRGFLPFTLDTIQSSVGLQGAPSSPGISNFFPAYGDSGVVPPDLTSASGWVGVLSQEDLPTDEFGFLTLSGLSGQALAADPTSAATLLSLCGDSVLVLPWSLFPPCATVPYDPSADAALCASLRSHLDPSLSSHLLLTWGFAYSQGLPTYRGQQIAVPCAYASLAGILREAESGNPLRPPLQSLTLQGPPYFLNRSLSEPPIGIQSHATPDPLGLETMRHAGLMCLTRGVSRLWTLHGALETLDGVTLAKPLCVGLLRDLTIDALDPFLGLPDSPQTESQVRAALQAITDQFLASNLGSFAANLQMTLLPTEQIGTLLVNGSLSLYSETRAVSFQVSVSG